MCIPKLPRSPINLWTDFCLLLQNGELSVEAGDELEVVKEDLVDG